MLRRVFSTYEDPPTDFAQTIHGPPVRTDGVEAQDTKHSSYAMQSTISRNNSGMKELESQPGGYNILLQFNGNKSNSLTGWH